MVCFLGISHADHPYKANDVVYDRKYKSVFWTMHISNYLCDLHPGYFNESHPKIMINPYIDEFLLENHPEKPYLSHKCYQFDSVFSITSRYMELRELNEQNETLGNFKDQK